MSRLLFEKIKGTTEVIFDEEIIGLQACADHMQVQFRHAGERRFDLVIGADGLHSNVRGLVFGPQDRFEKQLGYVVAAFDPALALTAIQRRSVVRFCMFEPNLASCHTRRSGWRRHCDRKHGGVLRHYRVSAGGDPVRDFDRHGLGLAKSGAELSRAR